MPFGFHLAMDTLPSRELQVGGFRSALAVSGFRLRARLGFSIPAFSLRPARHYPRFRIRRPSSGRQRDFNPPEQRAAQRTLWPLLTSGDPSPHLSMSVAHGKPPDLPGYCAPTFTLMRVGSTRCPSGQGSGFDDIGRLTRTPRLYPFPVRRASALPTASFRFAVARDTLAVRLTLPPVRRVMDLHHQVSAPCRAHQKKRGRISRPAFSVTERYSNTVTSVTA
jgi:hypothetical protein